jgi:hypothetical protein
VGQRVTCVKRAGFLELFVDTSLSVVYYVSNVTGAGAAGGQGTPGNAKRSGDAGDARQTQGQPTGLPSPLSRGQPCCAARKDRGRQGGDRRARTGGTDEGNCAEQSQTWGDWGVWVKANVAWGVARPASETCETKPNSKCEVSSLKFPVSDQENHMPGALTSNFTLDTSNFPPTGPVGGITCETNPIWPRSAAGAEG